MSAVPSMIAPDGPAQAIVYPESDGQPMAESDETRKLMIECIEVLDHHFQSQPEVYVSGNILIYYKEGDPKRSVSPDVLVAFGVGKRDRKTWKTWVEGRMPEVVFEICSDSTWRKDLGIKASLYSALGVKEYFLFDSTGVRLDTGPLLGMERSGDAFEEIAPNAAGRIHSKLLGLELIPEAGRLRFYDPATGRRLPTHAEAEAEALLQAQAAFKQAQEERTAREAAERELAALKAQLEALRAASGSSQ